MCSSKLSLHLASLLLILLGSLPFSSTQAEHDASVDKLGQNPIVGAGAHFSWVIFNDLKADLEKKTGRSINLYGKDSSLGMGCNAGIKNAKNYASSNQTFGFVCCELADEEVQANHLHVHPLALEPILILVNEANPVNNLSIKQARALFRGDIRNWSEVGGVDRPVVVVTRLHCKKRPGHWKRILPSADEFRKDRLNVKAADAMIRRVTDFKGAIGHTGATWMFTHQDRVKAVSIDGHEPTAANLASGKYPFYRTLSAVTSRRAKGDVLELIREVQQGHSFRKVAKTYQLLPLSQR